jgi:tetratricopeptide (TPR) repeat protein
LSIFIFSNEPDAESTCEQSLNEALNHYPESIDALLQLSNLRILRAKDDEALQYMDKIYDISIQILENNININNDQPPSSDMITNLAKNYSELKVYDKAIKLYDILIRINDEDVNI